MASQHILATPPSQDAILSVLLEYVRAYNTRLPRRYVGMRECNLDAEMPLLLNPPGAPLECREALAEVEAVNAHFSAQVPLFSVQPLMVQQVIPCYGHTCVAAK